MDQRNAPAFAATAAVVIGIALGQRAVYLPPGPLVFVLGGCFALVIGPEKRRWALWMVAAVAGALYGGASAPRGGGDPAEDRPVRVVGEVVSHPWGPEGERRLWLRTDHLRQGTRVWTDRRRILVGIPRSDGETPLPVTSPFALGETLRIRGYLKRIEPAAGFGPAREGPWRLSVPSRRFITRDGAPEPGDRWGTRLRAVVVEGLGDLPAETRGLATALLLGDTSDLDSRWGRGLRRAGLGHLLAVSGLHVALVGALGFLAAGRLPRRARLTVTAAVMLLYVLAVGPKPSAIRATAMGLLTLGALALERPPRALNALAVAVLVMVLQDPARLDDLGFRLSVSATLGILLLAAPAAQRWTALPPPLRMPLAVSWSAQLSVLPALLPLSGTLHPAAPLLGLVAIPWLAAVLVSSLLHVLAASAFPALQTATARCLGALTLPLSAFSDLPAHAVWTFPVTPSAATGWGALAAGLAVGWWPRRALRVLALLWILGMPGGGASHRGPLEVIVLDVGQGDSILLRDGERAALVDGGGWRRGDAGGRVLVPALARLGVRRLSAAVLTHGDTDHCGGLRDLSAYLPMEEIWGPPGLGTVPCVAELLTTRGPRWRPLWRGQRLVLGRFKLEVLWPRPADRQPGNDRSLVLSVRAGERRILLTGDIEEGTERRLLRGTRREDLTADVLKVAHHGSRSSSRPPFLAAVSPRIAVISAGGGNRFGHPHPGVLADLRRAGTQILRTDVHGPIRLRIHPDRARGDLTIDLPFAGRPRSVQ
ncbi:MAG: ComEC/Rec2 family competence protein [Acidobacteriota bacterium]